MHTYKFMCVFIHKTYKTHIVHKYCIFHNQLKPSQQHHLAITVILCSNAAAASPAIKPLNDLHCNENEISIENQPNGMDLYGTRASIVEFVFKTRRSCEIQAKGVCFLLQDSVVGDNYINTPIYVASEVLIPKR